MSLAPDAVQAAAGRLLPVAEVIAEGYAIGGAIRQQDIADGRAAIAVALAEGLTRTQCQKIHDVLQGESKRAWAKRLCALLGMESDLMTVLDWVQGEIFWGGTRSEPAAPAQLPRLDPAATCWLVSEDLGDKRRALRMFSPGYNDADREAALDWLVARGYGLAWVAMSITDGTRTNLGEWTYDSARDRATVRKWFMAAQAKGLRVAITLGLNHCRTRPWLDHAWVSKVLADVGDLVEWAAVAVEADETATAEQVRVVCGWITEAGLPAAVHCENPDHYPSHGAAAGIWLWQMRSWQGGTTAARAVAEYQEAKRKAGTGHDVYWWEFAFGDAPAALAIGDAVRAAGCPCAAPSSPRRVAVTQPANHSTPSNSSVPADVLEDGYKPTSGLPKAKIVCRAWDHGNDGQASVCWCDDRRWPSRTADNGKVLDAILYVYIVRDGVQIAARRLDHVAKGRRYKGLGNMFFDPADPYHAGNPFCDVGVRPRPGDQWAMVLTNQDGNERSTVTPLATWK